MSIPFNVRWTLAELVDHLIERGARRHRQTALMRQRDDGALGIWVVPATFGPTDIVPPSVIRSAYRALGLSAATKPGSV